MEALGGVRSAPELYAHALAMEREAAARYREFAERMAAEGGDVVARLFGELSALERAHAALLEQRAAGMTLPRLATGEHAWLDRGAPEAGAHDFVFRLMTPHDALAIALGAERRARRFFEQVRDAANDAALRDLAGELAREEQALMERVMQALEATPDPKIDWERVYADAGQDSRAEATRG